MGNPDKVKVGAGLLYLGPVGVTEPNDLTTPWATVDSDWVAAGYTDDGHEFSREPTFEPIEVAEEQDPIRYEQNANQSSVSFSAAELTVENLTYAYNGGTVTTISGTVVRFEPPEIGDVTELAIGWESNDGTERWVFRRCLQTGASTISRKKSPNKALIPMTFNLMKPEDGSKPFTVVIDTA